MAPGGLHCPAFSKHELVPILFMKPSAKVFPPSFHCQDLQPLAARAGHAARCSRLRSPTRNSSSARVRIAMRWQHNWAAIAGKILVADHAQRGRGPRGFCSTSSTRDART